ncbi:MAG TPA: helix-hairpin-helix domain-containing protein [Sphingomicrobium sp.]
MEFLQGYWPAILVAVALLVIAAVLVLRPRQRVRLTDSAPARPHMTYAKPPEGRGLAGEQAAAVSDVTGELIGAPVRRRLDGEGAPADDFLLLKGVGPKLADALHDHGFTRFEQIAHLTPTEIERIDAQLGAFRGRLTRDRIVEQADYLARGDIDGYEQRFGKLSA